ncbi:hypothetical protein CROQUDRAFT_87305 [Cronartium quercuum f. sp. fusiforme G11]|uniref:GAF domain-containing protein n=1 Tax=Cronartium quercuum f. sp. fusiforme G11 TaxID=708437 RepID=A0A9P6NPD3_9BASI|nr:hypothetical protein CROQUDRAFT_87305 [Cronartium quercuum f. sp. fusiforme G11]
MSDIVAAPLANGLPYSSLFSVPKKNAFNSRSSDYFWKKAVAPVAPRASDSKDTWLDNPDTCAWIDNEEVQAEPPPPARKAPKNKKFGKMRQVAFRGLTPKSGTKKPSIIITTEAISQKRLSANHPLSKNLRSRGLIVLTSWRYKSKGANTQVKKAVAIVRRRISSQSPKDQQPQTWKDYNHLYGTEQIDINDPPLPPTEPNPENPTPYELGLYCPPLAADETARQLIINRLGIYGKSSFDTSDEANSCASARNKLAKKLEDEGKEPKSLSEEWYRRSSESSLGSVEVESSETSSTPETLEQHPVFRKIVNRCREMFETAHCLISIMERDQHIFLAVSNGQDARVAPRDSSMCTHTVLSGRKGFVILDSSLDFRFKNGPLAVHWGARFYAGVPLLSPTLGADREEASYPIGTLCIIDSSPREQFTNAERKKLIFMAEYARLELEKWFLGKIERKVEILEESRKSWAREVEKAASVRPVSVLMAPPAPAITPPTAQQPPVEAPPAPPSEPRRELIKRRSFAGFRSNQSDTSTPPTSPFKKRSFASFAKSIRSEFSTPPTSPSSAGFLSPFKSLLSTFAEAPSLFDQPSRVLTHNLQTIFDLATQVVANTLDLSLAYLLAVESHPHSTDSGRTLILSSYNMPSPPPTFDAGLHIRVLRTIEGGLLYQNPTAQEARTAGLVSKSGSEPETYASALILAVGPHGPGTFRGFVLAGLTCDPMRVFGGEDANYMRQFATELSYYTSTLKL